MIVEPIGPDVRLHPAGPLHAAVRLPGSKSLTNRYLTCAALADGHSTLTDVAICDDTDRMLIGLRALEVDARLDESNRAIQISGGGATIPAGEAELDAGSAGTAMRFLTALCCTGYGRYCIDGSPRMRQRPIRQLVDGLCELGATIGYEGSPGFPPLNVLARGLSGGMVRFDSPPSSQFISALLMVAPCALRDTLIAVEGGLVSRPYVEMTMRVMRELGVDALAADDCRFIVPGAQRYRGGAYAIEPDASAAAYFWAAAALTSGRVRSPGLGPRSVQGDVGFVRVLERMGCRVECGTDWIEVAGPSPGELRAVDADLNAMPDTVQTLAVLALFARGATTIRNIGNLRIKETDRIAALEAELAKLGAVVEAGPDSLTIQPPAAPRPAAIDTYDDHRMAMSFALAGLVLEGVVIRQAACVSKSFPTFWEALDSLAPPRINEVP